MFVELPMRSRRFGRPVYVRVQEPSIGEFALGIPDFLPSAKDRSESRIEWERWVNAMLARVVVEPRLSPEQVSRLGADRSVLGERVLSEWGFSGLEPAYLQLYQDNFLTMVRRLSKFTRRLPTEILQLPTHEFWLNYAILFGKGSEHVAAEPDGVPNPADLFYPNTVR